MGYVMARCPDGHGRLLDGQGWQRMWCPHEDHGGNGRFFTWAELEAKEATMISPIKGKQGVPTEVALAAMNGDAEKPKRRTTAARATTAKAPKAGPLPRKVTGEPAPRVRKAKEPKACLCGCGEMTKGGRFRPGHDARYYAALGGHK